MNSTYNTLDWILVSYHQDDVIMISPSSPPDSDLSNVITQPPAEKVQQHIKNTQSEQDLQLPCNNDAKYVRRPQNYTRVIPYPPHLHLSPTNIYDERTAGQDNKRKINIYWKLPLKFCNIKFPTSWKENIKQECLQHKI